MRKRLQIIACPICGHLNKNLDLEDSKGWMECDRCGAFGIVPERSQDRFETQVNNPVRFLKPISRMNTGAASCR